MPCLSILFFILEIVLCFILPPLAVLLWMMRKSRAAPFCTPEFIFSLILSLLFWVRRDARTAAIQPSP